jgi:lysophospholipase L1-like esterase
MNAKKKVLLLGDSIRRSYQPIVAELLDRRAEVVGPAENCAFSAHTLANLDRWLGELGNPDIVHWNNGIHDVGHNPARTPVQYPLETYISNLSAILKKLRATGSKIIWATTTPVHPNRPFLTTAWSWRNEEIDSYNEAAARLMKAEGVPVNDLHAVVASDISRHLAPDMLHLSETGMRRCAGAVALVVEVCLKSGE